MLDAEVSRDLPQFKFLDFAAGGSREHLDQFEFLRQIGLRHTGVHQVFDHRLEGEVGPRFGLNEGATSLAEALVRHGDEGDVLDCGMAIYLLFDLDDGNILAAADNDVLGATNDANVAVGVDPGEVARLEPIVIGSS